MGTLAFDLLVISIWKLKYFRKFKLRFEQEIINDKEIKLSGTKPKVCVVF